MRNRVAGLLGALPDFAIALVALVTWIRPSPTMVRWLRMLMLVEFIVVHSAAFLGTIAYSKESPARRVKGTILVGLFYTLFLIGIALAFRTWWPILAFWGLTANRLLGVLLGQAPTGEERAFVQRAWGAGAFFYVVCVFPTVVLPLPRLGITRSMVSDLGISGGGQWVTEPHRAVVFAMVYFFAIGVSGMFGHAWMRERS